MNTGEGRNCGTSTGEVHLSHPFQILVVAPDATLAQTLIKWLNDACDRLVLVDAFAPAKAQLNAGPDLLITEARLGDYNGLHLALRARAAGIPSIVLGKPDRVSEREAFHLGASYLSLTRLRASDLLSLVANACPGDGGNGHPPTTSS